MSFVSCKNLSDAVADLESQIAAAAPNLTNCAGDPLAAGDSVPTCAEADAKIATAISAIPAATDTVAGKVALASVTETATGTDPTQALTPAGLAGALNATTPAGGNTMQKAVVNAVEAAISADTGAQTAIANAVKEEVASAIASDPTSMASITAGIPAATDTVQGKVSLAVAANYPSTSDTEAVTPAYLTSAVTAATTATPTASQAQAMATAIANDPTALATLLTAMSVFGD